MPLLAFLGVGMAESDVDTLESGVLGCEFVPEAASPPTVLASGGVVDGVLGGTSVLAAVAVSPPPSTVVAGGGVFGVFLVLTAEDVLAMPLLDDDVFFADGALEMAPRLRDGALPLPPPPRPLCVTDFIDRKW